MLDLMSYAGKSFMTDININVVDKSEKVIDIFPNLVDKPENMIDKIHFCLISANSRLLYFSFWQANPVEINKGHLDSV
ncbi:hypothetical protein [Mesobacillus jeotgali]|uniref:hypothetical protein n=1 Tax=Mesobacillus jeotgali TaxID=129985 RepID=UPI0009A77372|nr:hypothetical protein [Mesobacillus jeotgali]